MRGLASTQLSPGAHTCVVVGAVDEAEQLDLSRYRSVLWFTRDAAAATQPAGLDAARLRIEAVNRLDPGRATTSVDDLIRRDALHLPSVIVTGEAIGESADSYLPVIETIFAQFESHQRARTTRQQDGFTWQSHVLSNLSAYAHRRVPTAWAGALTGLPAFICGAGPSLDASLAKLLPFSERGVIFAADSALGALARVGVTADFAVSVDAGKRPEKCLVPGHASAGRVILASISPPDWQHSVSEHKLHYLSGKQLTEDALVGLGVEKTTVSIEENCGITALALALHLGCGPIYLFGMDHAVDSKEANRWHQRHADPSFEQQIGFHAGRTYPKVPGNYQAEIATPLFREWRALDARCAALPAGLVANVIDRGARLRNTTLVHPDTFSPGPGGADKVDRLESLATVERVSECDWQQMRASFERVADRAAENITRARAALTGGQSEDVIKFLAAAFKRREASLLFGNYSLKILPHLVRPDEADPGLWDQLLHECETLVTLAQNIR